ncbi:MAG: hypothetical protein NC177_04700 [Ruminococcus flavefaciens]|nr:hypothetical protein [Ruminococcus flavefaciens]
MKKIITLLLVVSMLSCTACGDKTSESESSIKDSSGSTSVVEDSGQQEESVSKTAEESENEEETDKESFYDFFGLSVSTPENLEYIDWGGQGYYNWGRKGEAEEKLYFAIIIFGMDYADYYDPESYSSEDVWEILDNEFELNIDNYYSIYKLSDAEVSTEENIDFLGADFIRSTGSRHLKNYDKEEYDILYSACYGALDFPAYGTTPECKKVPIMFVAFSDTDNDEVRTEMDRIIDNVAENSSWISEGE